MVLKSTNSLVSIMSHSKMNKRKNNRLTEEIFFVTQNFGMEKFRKCVEPCLLQAVHDGCYDSFLSQEVYKMRGLDG